MRFCLANASQWVDEAPERLFNCMQSRFRESGHTLEGTLQMVRKSVPALAVATLFMLAACGGPSGSSSATDKDGVKVGPGVTDSEIRVGLLSDFSGPIAE